MLNGPAIGAADDSSVRIALDAPTELDPARTGDAQSSAVIAQLFETLTTFDESLELHERLGADGVEVALEGGEVESSAHLNVMTQMARADVIDTFVVAGDFGLPDRTVSPETIALIQAASAGARRTASVCTGAFLLAASGLLNGKRATTHRRFASRLQAMYPAIRVDGDRIFLNEAGVWTSAGMTAGIDMALASTTDTDLSGSILSAARRRAYCALLATAVRAARSSESVIVHADYEHFPIAYVAALAVGAPTVMIS